MSKIYNADGFVNWEYLYNETQGFCMVTGARGTGKTFGLLSELLKRGVKFVYLRRLKTQLDQCATTDTNPFNAVNAAYGYQIEPFNARGVIRFCPSETNADGRIIPTGGPVAIGVALSTFATIRGADFSDFDAILFDEAIPMIGEKPIKNEFGSFQNFVETVNRNRELNGAPPVKCFLLGNANKLANPYYTGWGFMKTALNMIRGGQMMWRSADGRIMVMLLNSPISEKKRGTMLYKNANADFVTMALDNAFRTDATNIQSVSLRECVHVCSVGEIGIYRHKGTGRHYVSKTVSRETFYEGYGMRLKMWRRDYAMLKLFYLSGRMFFESYDMELIFREYCELN